MMTCVKTASFFNRVRWSTICPVFASNPVPPTNKWQKTTIKKIKFASWSQRHTKLKHSITKLCKNKAL